MAAAALGDASDTMMAHPLALQLRNLQTLVELVWTRTPPCVPGAVDVDHRRTRNLFGRESGAATGQSRSHSHRFRSRQRWATEPRQRASAMIAALMLLWWSGGVSGDVSRGAIRPVKCRLPHRDGAQPARLRSLASRTIPSVARRPRRLDRSGRAPADPAAHRLRAMTLLTESRYDTDQPRTPSTNRQRCVEQGKLRDAYPNTGT